MVRESAGYKLRHDLFELIQVMTAITSEHNLEKLLKLIVNSAIDITHCDAASLYLKDPKKGDNLRFVVTTCKSLENRMGKEVFEAQYKPFSIPISKESIAGFAAATGEIINLKDVYHIEDKPYSFNKSFDKNNQYRTRSMLTIPIINLSGQVIGVLQLINKLTTKNNVTVFKKYDEEIAKSLGAQAAVALDNARLTEDLKKAHYDSIMRLSAANEYRDNETGFHVKRVSEYCAVIASAHGLDDDFVLNLRYASPLHDIGKIGIPDSILKKPDKLTPQEYEIMKQHTIIGGKILGETDNPIMSMAIEVALTHHEKWNGSGYPYGLKQDNIPLSGRITAIADVFDALSNKRVYKPAFSLDQTFSIMKANAGTHFDPELIDTFFNIQSQIVDIFERYKEED